VSTTIDNNDLRAILFDKYAKYISDIDESYGILDVMVIKEGAKELILALKNDSQLNFNFLTSLCGIHFPHNEGKEIDVVYHLHSFSNNLRLRLHVLLSSIDPKLPTISDVFPTANWMERETFEFYGVKFEGHPDLRVILNVEDIGYHPLLKQYKLVDDTRTDKEDKYFGR
jgi:NADH-quinone oxidoreductase subunit C